MKRQLLSGLILLMCFSLAGIIVLQLYWIHHALLLKQESYSRVINEVLLKVAGQVEKKEQAGVLKRYVRIHDNDQSINSAVLRRKVEKADSVILINEVFSVDTLIEDTGQNHSRVEKYAIVGTDLTETGKSKRLVRSFHFSDSTSIASADSLMLQGKGRDIQNLIRQIVLDLETSKVPIRKRIHPDSLEHLLMAELENRGIQHSFGFALKHGYGAMAKEVFSKGMSKEDTSGIYRTRVFSSDVSAGSNYWLMLYIPGQRGMILASMWGILSLSAIFTMIILVVFVLSLRIIIKQKKMSEIRNDFINNMTHEFKTPIATISLAAEAVQNEKVRNDADKLDYYTRMIREENRRMNKHVERVLQLALTEKDDCEMERTETDVHTLIGKSCEAFALQLQEKNISLQMKLNAEQFTVSADAFHLANSIKNILDNAIKYSAVGSSIELITLNKENRLYIQVGDQGIGISREQLKRIFDKFYRVPTGDVHNVKGFGIGLSYVQRIMEKHGGEVLVQSEPGVGSVFTLILNLA